MDMDMITLAAFGQTLTGNGWVDSIVILGGLCAIALLLKKVKDEFWPKEVEDKPLKVSPNPLPVELVKSLATLEDLDKLRAEVKHEIEGLRRDMKDDDNGIHRRVGAISVKLATVDGKLNTISNNLNLLIEKAVK